MFRKALIGLVLMSVVGIISACGFNFLGFLIADVYSSNGVMFDDNFLVGKFLTSLCIFAFSLFYFSNFKRPSKNVLGGHFLAIVVLVGYFANQYILIRNEQRQVLMKYQEFRQALITGDYERAYELMAPQWRVEHSIKDVKDETEGFVGLGFEDSTFSVHIYGERAEIVPNSYTSWWYRPAAGESWMFEKVGTEWYVSPRNMNYYLPYSYILTTQMI